MKLYQEAAYLARFVLEVSRLRESAYSISSSLMLTPRSAATALSLRCTCSGTFVESFDSPSGRLARRTTRRLVFFPVALAMLYRQMPSNAAPERAE